MTWQDRSTNSPGSRKLKCPGERPVCSRCIDDNITCVYSMQKVMGRPRKRKLNSRDQSTSDPIRGTREQTSLLEPNLFDSVTERLDKAPDQMNPSDIDLSHINTTNEINLLTSSIQDIPSDQSCACLSSMYLTLDNIRSMKNFSFPASLHCLRDALGTAELCIDCRVCPNQYLTATQNAQLLGTLLLSMSERYNRILKTIESDTIEAEEVRQTKTLQIGSTGMVEPRHEHIGSMAGSSEPLVLELPPSEWKRLAKKVVNAEVHGTSDPSRASFMSILATLEERQARWHMMEPTDDCPNPERRRHDMHDHNNNPMCLMLAREAKKLVDLFDFS